MKRPVDSLSTKNDIAKQRRETKIPMMNIKTVLRAVVTDVRFLTPLYSI